MTDDRLAAALKRAAIPDVSYADWSIDAKREALAQAYRVARQDRAILAAEVERLRAALDQHTPCVCG